MSVACTVDCRVKPDRENGGWFGLVRLFDDHGKFLYADQTPVSFLFRKDAFRASQELAVEMLDDETMEAVQ